MNLQEKRSLEMNYRTKNSQLELLCSHRKDKIDDKLNNSQSAHIVCDL